MRRYLRNLTLRTIYNLWRRLYPTPQKTPETETERWLKARMDALIAELGDPEKIARQSYVERIHELHEARQMAGSGPWLPFDSREHVHSGGRIGKRLREANPFLSQGSTGDIELALQNVQWRREVNFSLIEFSRWGITQIILISRLYRLKNPMIRRAIEICSYYTFGRGFEISSPDDDANALIKDMMRRNSRVFGQAALTELHAQKYTDGNIFWVAFTDADDTGEVNFRTIDALEVMDIICDPDDADVPQYYRRVWTERHVDIGTGNTNIVSQEAYYPAMYYEPMEKPPQIGSIEVRWDQPVYHRKVGGIAKWKFGCPKAYPALDWAKESRHYLEACMSDAQARAQIAMTITTKGGQQAIEGVKSQMQTTVGPASPIWDANPPAVAGATFASGPGTKVEAFDQKGGMDPEKVRQYKLCVWMVFGVPETFGADVSTGNLATATTLDRPTELVMLAAQEEWREDLVLLTRYALEKSAKAPSGLLKESMRDRGIQKIRVVEMSRRRLANGQWVYEAAKKKTPGEIEIKCTFPTIREGDQKDLMTALVDAATLGNKGGQYVGIDEKEFVKRAYEIVGIENGDEIAEEQYGKDYDPDRTKVIEPPPIVKLKPNSGGEPQVMPGQPQPDVGTSQEQTPKPNGHA